MPYKRYFPSARGKARKAGYRSGLELNMKKWMDAHCLEGDFESDRCKFKYVVPATKHNYTCDFAIDKLDGGIMYIETKGIWSAEDRQKMYLLKMQHPEVDFRMAFYSDPTKRFIGKKGATSYADVCEGRGKNRGIFKWSEFSIPYTWADGGTLKSRPTQMLPYEWMRECIGYADSKPEIFYKGDLF